MTPSPTSVVIVGTGPMAHIAQVAIEETPHLQTLAMLGKHDPLQETLIKLKPQVALDLSVPSCVFKHAQLYIEQGIHPVIGTSGLAAAQIEILTQQAASQKLGGLIVPNFCLSALWMLKLCESLRGQFLDVHIIESHHPQKKDAPSQTARHTKAILEQGEILSIRSQGILAEQSIVFGAHDQTLTLTQRTLSRTAFKPGIVLALEQVTSLNDLVLGLESLL